MSYPVWHPSQETLRDSTPMWQRPAPVRSFKPARRPWWRRLLGL